MTKKSNKLLLAIFSVLTLAFVLVGCKTTTTSKSINVVMNGETQVVKVGEKITAPDYQVGEYQTFLGWGLEENKTSSSDVRYAKGAEMKYEDLLELAGEKDTLSFYPVISTKNTIEVTIKGVEDKKTILVEGSTTIAEVPNVSVGKKQVFLGWATTEGATTATVEKGSDITYTSILSMATDGKVTLYPVVETYDLVVGIVPVKFAKVDEEGNVIKSIEEYIEEIKAAFSANHTEKVLFRVYDGNVSECGAQINADDDVDVVLAGNNIDGTSETEGNVVVRAKAKIKSEWNADGSRRAALITDTHLALDMYAMVIGSENVSVEVTIKLNAEDEGVTTVVNKALANSGQVPEVTPPETKILVGFARTIDATEPEFTGSVVDYDTVKDLAVDGKVVLYPVFGNYDLVVAIWAINGSNTYATQEEIDAVKTAFDALLEEHGATAVVRFDVISGSSKSDNETYYPNQFASDVMVVLSGKNIISQCGTVGAFEVVNYSFSSTRYAGYLEANIPNNGISIELVSAFIEMLCEKEVTVTIKLNAEDTGVSTTLSKIMGNSADVESVVAPEGMQLKGFALTVDAEEVLLRTGAITFAQVAEHATDGAITLFPIFENIPLVQDDLVLDVLFKNIEVEDIEHLISEFKAYLASQGDTKEYQIVFRNDFSGTGANFLSRVASSGDVDVVIGASNLVTQSGNEIMTKTDYAKISETLIPGTSRCIGTISGCKNMELAEKFVSFCQGNTVLE